jgi:hypothetical protein
MRDPLNWVLFSVAMATTVLVGRWGKALLVTSEYVHFSVNFPARRGAPAPDSGPMGTERRGGLAESAEGRPPQLSRSDLGGPWARLAEHEWTGYPAGGLLVWGREGSITIDIGRRGVLKAWLQPRRLLLSTHWLRNVGTS